MDRLIHNLDAEAFSANPPGLGTLVAAGHRFFFEGGTLAAEVERVRAYPGAEKPPFAALDDARRSFEGPFEPEAFPSSYVGDTVVDAVLHEILQVDSPNIWQSLLAFNVGVEIGQIVIILASWPLFRLVARRSDRAWALGRWGVALPCVTVATVWTVQRALLVLQSL